MQGQRPCWGLGQRPNRSSSDQFQGSRQQGAGSEASLPVTSRVRRRASKLLFPTSVLCRARWARPCSWSCDQSCSFPQAGISRLRARPEGFAVALWTASHALPCYLILIVAEGFRLCGGDQRAMKTDEVCDRPLETFGAATFGVICGLNLCCFGNPLWSSSQVQIAGCQENQNLPAPRLSYASFSTVIFPSVTFSRTRSPSAILPPNSSSLSVSSTVR